MNDAMKIIITSILVVCGIGVVISHVRLIQLEKNNPELLRAAGIKKIDWWWSCLRGIYRLGFTALGNTLPIRTRIALRLALATYAVVVVGVGLATILEL